MPVQYDGGHVACRDVTDTVPGPRAQISGSTPHFLAQYSTQYAKAAHSVLHGAVPHGAKIASGDSPSMITDD